MGDGFGLINLIFLVIAIAVFIKLRSVLGRRTGHERPPYDPYSAPSEPAPNDDGKVITLPRASDKAPEQTAAAEAAEAKSWSDIAPAGSELAQGLTEVSLADRAFDPDSFLSGARMAYEMVVTGFAAGDRNSLKSLLSDDVYRSFDAAISDREAKGLAVEMNFVGVKSAAVTAARLRDRLAQLTVKFVSELTSATKNADGAVVEGDPVTVRSVTDVWTFERDVNSRDPNWRVIATEAA